MPHHLAAAVAALSLEELSTFVEALPAPTLACVRALAKHRDQRERVAAVPPPTVVVNAAAERESRVMLANEAATTLGISLDTLYARVEHGDLVPLPRPRKGRLKFARAYVREVANGADQRYTPPHDQPRRASPPAPTRLDPAPARGDPQRDRHDRRPLGTGAPQRDAPRRDDPYAPGQAAWRDRPKPPKG